jgi:DNA-binding CsgD family transcriptional regulator/tetratricopeptide (TPR) repeat protein
MSAAERQVARAVAVAADPCECWFVERVVGGSRTRVGAVLEDLIVRGVLVDRGGRLRPASGAQRAAILRSTPPSLLASLHHRAAEVLAAAGLPALAAGQLIRAVRAGCHVDAGLASEVAAAPSVDPALVADLLIALRERPARTVRPAVYRAWTLSTVDNLMLAGRSQEALELLSQELAADRDPAEHRALLLGRLGGWYAAMAPSLALDCLDRALGQAGPEPSSSAWLLATACAVAGRVGHPDGEDLLARAERAQVEQSFPGGGARLALARSAVALARGDLPAAAGALGTADPGDPSARPQAAVLRAERIAVRLKMGEFAEVRAALDGTVRDLGTLGAAVGPKLASLGCLQRMSVGDLPEAAAQAQLALRQHPARRLPDEVRSELLAVIAEVLFRQGRPERARPLLRPAEAALDWPDAMSWLQLRCAAAGDTDPGRNPDLVRAAVAGVARSPRPLLLVPQAAARLVRAALGLGDERSARTIAGLVAGISARCGIALWQGVQRHVTGLIEHDPDGLGEAVARLRTTGAPTALADALLDLASLPRTPNAAAREAAAESAALYGRIGATGDQDRASRWADAGRLARSGRRPARSADRGIDALTDREARVAELLAAGITKRQAAAQLYVSFHTVDSHARAVYAKLGVRSRVELVRLWDTRQPAPRAG